ncbi:Hypothetical_protein [Hexamita inflata]|uniref:Hypothetical_protein n=1 Tax=Hexamita inflata TaxID=28002 RepID=A0AA86U3X5_9EUKA|nr:Hypothetical protein HINF_LOCUS24692 [Hexamita inflata]
MSDAYNAFMHAKTYMTSITQINNNHIYGSLYTTLAPLEQCPAAMQRSRAGCEGCRQYPRCCEKSLVRLGITVSISGFHPGDPGPIPGVGVFLFRCCGVSARIPPLPTRHFSFCYFSTSLRSLPNSVSIDRNWSDACMLAKSTWLASSLPSTRKYDWDGIRTHAQQVKSPSKRPPQTARPPSHQSPGLLEGVAHYLLNLLISIMLNCHSAGTTHNNTIQCANHTNMGNIQFIIAKFHYGTLILLHNQPLELTIQRLFKHIISVHTNY